MTFSDVVNDIRKLIGINLESVRPGANITIMDVDEEHGNLTLRTSQGVIRSRPLGELLLIWNELSKNPAVHVDGVLHGSGTSRNQPETILANLPYIEWLKIDNKKNIAYVGKNTHAYGTLKRMNSIDAADLCKKVPAYNTERKVNIVIVTANITDSITSLQTSFVGTLSTISQGAYLFDNSLVSATVISSTLTILTPGTYSVLPRSSISTGRTVTILGTEYYSIDSCELKMLSLK